MAGSQEPYRALPYVGRLPEAISKREFEMSMLKKVFLASIVTLSIGVAAHAQNPKEGDYYAPGPTTPVHLSPGQKALIKDGDYYAGETMILGHKRMAALKKCTDGIKFASDRYVKCMASQGESP